MSAPDPYGHRHFEPVVIKDSPSRTEFSGLSKNKVSFGYCGQAVER